MPPAARAMIPLNDLVIEPSDLDAIAETLRTGSLTMGARTEAFEAAFAEHLGARHAIAVSTCTGALHLAYLAAGVGPGDEVIVPSYTFVATAAAVLYCGATPVFADITGLHDPSIDPAHVEALITSRTVAVTCVHFAGYPAAVERLQALCDRRGLALIEDCAHAPSAAAGSPRRMLGTFGRAGCFSFFSNKVLAAGEGGLLCTDDDDVAQFARTFRSQAMTSGTWPRNTEAASTYDVIGPGFNHRIDEPRAALLLSRLGRLDAQVAALQARTRRYRELLAGVAGIVLPFSDESVADSSCHVFPVMLADEHAQGPLRVALREQHGVQTSLMYPSVHRFSAYRERFGELSLPRTERASRCEVTLPLFAHMTEDDQDRVVRALRHELQASARVARA